MRLFPKFTNKTEQKTSASKLLLNTTDCTTTVEQIYNYFACIGKQLAEDIINLQ